MRLKCLKNEKGAVLITMLLLLVIMTIIGAIAINTSTLDIQLTGFMRRSSQEFAGAEAGFGLAVPIIETTLLNAVLPAAPADVVYGSTTIVSGASLDNTKLASEIAGSLANDSDTIGSGAASDTGSDIVATVNNVSVALDVDYVDTVQNPGCSAMFAMGYEGIGAGGGCNAMIFRIESRGVI